ncbi:integrase catalytic domain-containing protein [Neptunomonas qingdaonensis]|uniref:Putative transposase n=1 Tax=Neptunomonas qingdaonensis TaxID=1045558 RepID=A0A1I2TMH9_9GAMM|nr:Mu transposase C-terminal domain-containing protein [Neptunomonas qingdaonensis]SFG66114.1 putative transposase [Neptunomonas qingdaonensis]
MATPDLLSKSSGLFEDEFSPNEPEIPFFEEPSAEIFPRDLKTYPAELRDEALRRLAYIQWVGKRLEGGWTEKNLTPLLHVVGDKLLAPLPSWRTLAGWRKLYVSSGRSVEALIPKHHKKGNRLEQNTGDDLYYWQAVNQKYLRPERPSIASVYEYYRDLITLANKGVVQGKVMHVSRSGFYNRINKLPPYDVALKRYGKQYADRKYRPVGAHITLTRVMERVEIDHTPLDLILLDDELNIPLGRPYLTLLIDSYSHCVVGFYLGYREPSYDSVCKALLNACLDKSYVKKQYPHIQHDWECSGKIETLVVDNGAEFWSKNLDQLCRVVVSDIQYNPVAHPWLKPLVERFFGTVNKKLLVSIPGKTFSKIDDLKDYNPKKDAVMRFSAFIDVFYKWIIDVYHRSANARETHIPYLSWQIGVSEFPPAQYTGETAERLIIELGQTFELVLRKGGLHLKGIHYENDELVEYRRSTSLPSGKKSLKLLVKLNPMDMSCIYVYLKDQDRYIKVPSVDPDNYTQGLTLLQHQTNKRLIRYQTRRHVDMESLAEARQYIEQRVQEEVDNIQRRPKRPSKSIGGMKSLAKHQNVGSDSVSSVVPSKVPMNEKVENQKPESDDLLDNWDDMVSDLDPY